MQPRPERAAPEERLQRETEAQHEPEASRELQRTHVAVDLGLVLVMVAVRQQVHERVGDRVPPIQPKSTKASANTTDGYGTDLFVLEVMLYSNFRRDVTMRREAPTLDGRRPDGIVAGSVLAVFADGHGGEPGALIGMIRGLTAHLKVVDPPGGIRRARSSPRPLRD